MGELVAIFLVTFLVVSGLVLALTFGRAPTYRPTRDSVLSLMHRVAAGERDPRQWDLFLGMPIPHDSELESIRRKCVEYHEGLNGDEPSSEGVNGEIYDRKGRDRVEQLALELERIIREAPISREF